MGGFCGSGPTRRAATSTSSSPVEPLRRPRFNDFIRNVTDPQGLANEMGASEDRTIVSSGGITRNLRPDEKRFQRQADGHYITKPYQDTRTQAQKDRDDRADARAAKEREKAASVTPVVEEEETTTTPPDTPTAPVYTPTDYGNPSNTAAAQSVLEDQDRGPKSGTIETSAQGISKEDKSGLRPKRKLKPKGLLNPETPARNQSLLAAA